MQALAQMHPLGLRDDWADKLAGGSPRGCAKMSDRAVSRRRHLPGRLQSAEQCLATRCRDLADLAARRARGPAGHSARRRTNATDSAACARLSTAHQGLTGTGSIAEGAAGEETVAALEARREAARRRSNDVARRATKCAANRADGTACATSDRTERATHRAERTANGSADSPAH